MTEKENKVLKLAKYHCVVLILTCFHPYFLFSYSMFSFPVVLIPLTSLCQFFFLFSFQLVSISNFHWHACYYFSLLLFRIFSSSTFTVTFPLPLLLFPSYMFLFLFFTIVFLFSTFLQTCTTQLHSHTTLCINKPLPRPTSPLMEKKQRLS